MTSIRQEWYGYHTELLGRLAASTESLTEIRPGAPLEAVAESLTDLQEKIDEAEHADETEAEEEEEEEDEEEEE